jgi:hypothetical protein
MVHASRLPKILLVGLLIGMSAGFHLRNATAFIAPGSGKRFYWQLSESSLYPAWDGSSLSR